MIRLAKLVCFSNSDSAFGGSEATSLTLFRIGGASKRVDEWEGS